MDSTEKVLLEIQLNYSDSVKKSAELTTEINKLKDSQKELKKAGQDNTEQFIANARALDALKNQQKDLTSVINQSVKATGAQAGSLNQLQAEILNLRKQYNELSETERENATVGGALIRTIKEKNDTLKKAEAIIGDTRRNVGNYSDSLIGLKSALKEAQGEMIKHAQTLGRNSKEYQEASLKAGQLKDILKDTSEDLKSSTGEGFERIGNSIEGLKGSLMDLDFGRVKEQIIQLQAASKATTLTEMINGVGGLGSSLKTLAVTIITNPLFILAGVIGGIAIALKNLYDGMNNGVEIYKKSSEELGTLRDTYNSVKQEIIQLQIENDVLSGKISKADGEILKNTQSFKEEYLKIVKEAAESEAKIREAAAKERDDDGFKGTKNLLDKLGFETATTKAAKQSVLDIEKQKNENIEALRQKFKLQNDQAVINETNEQIAANKKRSEELKKIKEDELKAKLKLEEDYYNAQVKADEQIVQNQNVALNKLISDREKAYNAANETLRKTFVDAEIIRTESLKNGKITEDEFALQQLTAKEIQIESQIALDQKYYKSTTDSELELAQTKLAISKKSTTDKQKLDKAKAESEQQTVNAIAGILAQSSQLAGQQTAAGKALAIANTTFATYESATKAFNAMAGIPIIGPALGGIAAGLAVASGLANIEKISAAAGGGDFMTNGPTLLLVGDNPGGKERVTVEPISGRGQTYINPNSGMVAMAGGGTLTVDNSFGGYAVRNNTSNEFDYEKFAKVINKMPAQVLQVSTLKKVNTAESKAISISSFK